MSKEKVYHVTIPLTGSLFFIIKGKENMTEEEIFEKCLKEKWQIQMMDINPNVELGEQFELHKQVTQGNLCHAACPDMDYFIEDEEE